MSKSRASVFFVVDRIEGRGTGAIAVLVSDDDRAIEVPASLLKKLAVEGAVLRVPAGTGEPDWSRATRDREEENRRLEQSKDVLRRLSANDPGGDLVL